MRHQYSEQEIKERNAKAKLILLLRRGSKSRLCNKFLLKDTDKIPPIKIRKQSFK
jgi:hypothetical protein